MYLSKASLCLITKLNYCAVPINQVCVPGVGRAHGAGQAAATDIAWGGGAGWGGVWCSLSQHFD